MGAPVLSPEVTRSATALARYLASAARTWSLYPPEHPAVGASVERLGAALVEATGGAPFGFGVMPKTLVVAGVPLSEDSQPVADAAELLHDHDILQITFLGPAPVESLHALLTLLRTEAADLRAQGGPAAVWEATGHPSVAIEQIDYAKILEDSEEPPPERKDDVWQSLVTSLTAGARELNAQQQARLLEISSSAFEIGELATAAASPQCGADGSPMITTQAATVLATFRHLAGIVTVMEPERLPEVMKNLAAASATLDPNVIMQVMQMDENLQEEPIVARLAESFDDSTVAQMLAGALSRDGKAHTRLAKVFDTIAPDQERKQRVLKLARNLLAESDFGKTGQFKAAWTSMEELLLKYDESPFVDAAYQATLEGAGHRAEAMAKLALPPEMETWKESLEQDNVRALSVMLITDLLRMEEDAERAAEIAGDMVPLVEDLFSAGDFANAAIVLKELADAAAGTLAPKACRAALVAAAESHALVEAVSFLGDLDGESLDGLTECCVLMGPTMIRALYPLLRVEEPSAAYERASGLVGRFGAGAADELLALADEEPWFVQRNAAQLLALTRAPGAVPALQAMLRRGDPRVLRPAVIALAGIDDPSAGRALHTALRVARGAARLAIVEALVAERDTRVVPMLVQILAESDPFGSDHDTVLSTLDALRQLPDPRAVPQVRTLMARTRWFRRRKSLAFKTACVAVLDAVGTDDARAALDTASREGDRLLRKILRGRAA